MTLHPNNSEYSHSKTNHFWAVPNVHNFLENFADTLVQNSVASPLENLKTIVILPTRRSCRHLKNILLHRTLASSIIPPTLTTFSDIGYIPNLNFDSTKPNPWQMLAKIFKIVQLSLPESTDYKTILDYAQTLLPLMEEWIQHGKTLKDIQAIFPGHLAEHLQDHLSLFYKVLEKFPINESRAAHQKNAFHTLIEQNIYQKMLIVTTSPQDPIAIDFLSKCRQKRDAKVFLLGFNPAMCGDNLSEPQPYHPHYGYSQLLAKAEVNPADISIFAQNMPDSRHSHLKNREQFLWCTFSDDYFMPQENSKTAIADAFQNVSLLECNFRHQEAGSIAVIMREAMEIPSKKVALITPDRNLAALVKAQLRRWDIEIDDSAGEPFFLTPTGSFLKLIADCMMSQFAPLELLSLLKHPFSALHHQPRDIRRIARRFEKAILRKASFKSPGIDAWRQRTDDEEIKDLLKTLKDKSTPFYKIMLQDLASLSDLLKTHLQFAIELATTTDEAGERILFKGEIGEAIAKKFQEFIEVADDYPACHPKDYLSIFITFFHDIRVRKTYGYHPRLHILEPEQAQLETYDCVILGGLNAGSWPRHNFSDPWFSQEMRKSCGLPTFAHQAGYEVLHFINMLNSPEVIITRAQKSEGALFMPSPWLQRLQTVFKILKLENVLEPMKQWQKWQHHLDTSQEYLPTIQPRPTPAVQYRPRELSVTDVEKLMADPYTIYARKILGLRPTPPLLPDAGGALFGNLVHQALDQFYNCASPEKKNLEQLGQDLFHPFKNFLPVFYGFYWPRYVLLSKWVHQQYHNEKDDILHSYTEVPGFLELNTKNGVFRLTAIADRIDLLKDGTLRIIDYKTGQLPTLRQFQQGERPQLLLEALIAEKGQFQGVTSKSVSALEFWHLGRHIDGGERLRLENDLSNIIGHMEQRLLELIQHYGLPNTSYQPAWKALPYCPYSHLARRAEWSAAAL